MKEFKFVAKCSEDGLVTVDSINQGFTGLEIIGLLEEKKADILDQLLHYDRFTRTIIDSDGNAFEVGKEDENDC